MKNHSVKQLESPGSRPDPSIRIQELHKEADSLRSEITQLKKSLAYLEQRNHEMLKNEIQYRNTIKSYQLELKKKINQNYPVSDTAEKFDGTIIETHREIFENIGKIQLKIDEILTAREETIISVYDSKLRDITKNLENEKKEKYEYLEGLAEREHTLSKELEMLKGSVGVIESKNTYLEHENKELKKNLKVKDLEIEELEKKMFEFKQQSLRFPSIKGAKSTENLTKPLKEIKTNNMAIETSLNDDQNIARYQKIISKLQKLLIIEKNNLRAARNAYFREINSRSEIEEIIINCIEEVNKEIKNANRKTYKLSYNMAIVEKLTNNEKILKELHEFIINKENKE